MLGLPIGVPQVFAGLLLLAFLVQALFVVWRTPLRGAENAAIQQGLLILKQRNVMIEAGRAPLSALLAALPVAAIAGAAGPVNEFSGLPRYPQSWRWLARAPFVLVGLLLGCSIWYVARRLYGNAGGYIALTLYAFSDAMVSRAATAQPTIVGLWGAFGVVFTAIAVAHTLYAPREVILWNWKRILLLGLAITLAVGAQFALVFVVLAALGFMLYVVPERRRETLTIFIAACALAMLILAATFAFDGHAIATGLRSLSLRDFAPGLLAKPLTYRLLALFFFRLPTVFVLLVASLATYALWRKPRFFGVTAPLLVWAMLMVLGIVLPHLGGYNLFTASLPFAFVLIAGVFADLLESAYASLALGVVGGILLAHAAFALAGLVRF